MWRVLFEFTVAALLAVLFALLVLPWAASTPSPAAQADREVVGKSPDAAAVQGQISSNTDRQK